MQSLPIGRMGLFAVGSRVMMARQGMRGAVSSATGAAPAVASVAQFDYWKSSRPASAGVTGVGDFNYWKGGRPLTVLTR